MYPFKTGPLTGNFANRLWMLFGVVVIYLILAQPSASKAQDQPLRIAYPEFYPFFAETPQGRPKGFFFDIVTEALERRMNIPTQWRKLPWKRCQAYVKDGIDDAMITVPTQERLAYARTHSTPFYEKKLTLFTYQGHKALDRITAIRSAQDIKAEGFSVITYSGNGWHQSHIASLGIPTLEVPQVHLIWKMLAARRGDLVIEWPVGVYSGMKEAGIENEIIETGAWLEAMKFHLMISKKSPLTRILTEFNCEIEGMFADGTMDRILAPYLQGQRQN